MRTIGVCSWSLRPDSAADLLQKLLALRDGPDGLRAVQLALDPIRRAEWDENSTARALADAGFTILSGMMGMKGEDYSTLESIKRTGGVRMDETWPENLAAAEANADIAARLGLQLVTLHAGFLPHDPADPQRGVMLDRLRRVADVFHARDIVVGFETGQESAQTLIAVLDELDHPAARVNFDPANMILYAMGDPVAALAALAPRVAQVHIKDALPTTEPGTWGKEVPAGAGAVDWPGFFRALADVPPGANLVIEREDGGNRLADVRAAARLVRSNLRA